MFTSRPIHDLWTSEGERIPAVFERSAMRALVPQERLRTIWVTRTLHDRGADPHRHRIGR